MNLNDDILVTLSRKMDNGYGVVSIVQKQTFSLSKINKFLDNPEPFTSIDSLAEFLNEKKLNEDYDFLNDISGSLEASEDHDNFISTANPNGFGNKVDNLTVEAFNKIIFLF
jgi:hypothetical protein